MKNIKGLILILLVLLPLITKAHPFYKPPGLSFYIDAGISNYNFRFDVCQPTNPTFRAVSNPTISYTYQWYKIDFAVYTPSMPCLHNTDPEYFVATSNEFTITSSGKYRCKVISGKSSYYTDYIYVYRHVDQPINLTVNTPTASQNICPGQSVTLSVTANDDYVNCQNRVKYQ